MCWQSLRRARVFRRPPPFGVLSFLPSPPISAFLRKQDTIGFAGMKMIRRVVGISHVEDLDGIEDRPTKASCETHALALGRRLAMVSATSDGGLDGADDVCDLARSLGSGGSGDGSDGGGAE